MWTVSKLVVFEIRGATRTCSAGFDGDVVHVDACNVRRLLFVCHAKIKGNGVRGTHVFFVRDDVCFFASSHVYLIAIEFSLVCNIPFSNICYRDWFGFVNRG